MAETEYATDDGDWGIKVGPSDHTTNVLARSILDRNAFPELHPRNEVETLNHQQFVMAPLRRLHMRSGAFLFYTGNLW